MLCLVFILFCINLPKAIRIFKVSSIELYFVANSYEIPLVLHGRCQRNISLQKLCGKVQSRFQCSSSEPIYSSIDSYPIRIPPPRGSKRRQSDVSEAGGVVLVTEYEDTEPLLLQVRQNESDSESSWDEDLGDGQVEVEIYEGKDECFIERDELFESTIESRSTSYSEQTFLKNIGDTLDSEQNLLKDADSIDEDAYLESARATSLISINDTGRTPISSEENCAVSERDQIALYTKTVTSDNNKRYSSEAKQGSSVQNSNHYEQLGDTSDDHHYTLTPPPQIIQAICEEMEEQGITAEQVIDMSRANTHNNNDDDDSNTESPVTDYM